MSEPVSLPPSYRRTPLRIACVQFDVKLGKVAENVAKVTSMTSRLGPGQLDLLVLPEMALSGYVFAEPSEIVPFLEKPSKGPTSTLAAELAARLRCHVIAGYPEELDEKTETVGQVPNGTANGLAEDKIAPPPPPGVGYNSALLASPAGEIIGNYRKTFLFETDKIWSREGDGFSYFDLPEPLGRVSIGICMDLNPKEFMAPWNAFELATYCVKNKVDVLVVPMNWLDPGEQDPSDSGSDDGERPPPHDPEAPSESNLNYWAARLTPFHDPTPRYDPSSGVELGPAETKELVFVACNRVGKEGGTKFVGTSCVMTLRSNPSGIELVECCNRSEERVMICQVT